MNISLSKKMHNHFFKPYFIFYFVYKEKLQSTVVLRVRKILNAAGPGHTYSGCLSYCHQMPFIGTGDSQIFDLVSAFEDTKTRHFLNNAASAIS